MSVCARVCALACVFVCHQLSCAIGWFGKWDGDFMQIHVMDKTVEPSAELQHYKNVCGSAQKFRGHEFATARHRERVADHSSALWNTMQGAEAHLFYTSVHKREIENRMRCL